MTAVFSTPAWQRVVAAQRRYENGEGDIYAAGISYFTIFALFPLLMMGFAVAGFVLAGRPALLAEIDNRVKAAVPGDISEQVLGLIDAAIESRASVGLIGLVTALYVGLLWVQRLRAALTQMWQQDGAPRGFLRTKLSDMRALIGIFAASVLTVGLTALADPIGALAGPWRLVSLAGSVLVSWGLFTVMIARLPRRPVAIRHCRAAGLLAALGFEVFKQVASLYLRVVLHGPAGVTFGPVLGLMVFVYMTARLVLFATCWAAERSEATATRVHRQRAAVPPQDGGRG